MKYLISYFKYAVGAAYLILKFLLYSIFITGFFVILFLWYFNFKFVPQMILNVKEEWKCYYIVYYNIGRYHSKELYRYNTLKDWVYNNKNYSHKT
jgi:hypothetical protein